MRTLLLSAVLYFNVSVVLASDPVLILLSEAHDNFVLMSTLKGKGYVDNDVSRKFDERVLKHIILLRALSPDIKAIRGDNLSALCTIIKYSDSSKLSSIAENDPHIIKLAIDYTKKIEPLVMNEIRKAQRVLGGKGCEIGGAGIPCPFKDKSLCK